MGQEFSRKGQSLCKLSAAGIRDVRHSSGYVGVVSGREVTQGSLGARTLLNIHQLSTVRTMLSIFTDNNEVLADPDRVLHQWKYKTSCACRKSGSVNREFVWRGTYQHASPFPFAEDLALACPPKENRSRLRRQSNILECILIAVRSTGAAITAKRMQLQLLYRQLGWLIGTEVEISIELKLRTYMSVMKPVWT